MSYQLSKADRRRRFKLWLGDAVERCAKTFVQVFLATMSASQVADQFGVLDAYTDVDALAAAALAGVGGVFSLVTSALSRWAGSPTSASLVD